MDRDHLLPPDEGPLPSWEQWEKARAVLEGRGRAPGDLLFGDKAAARAAGVKLRMLHAWVATARQGDPVRWPPWIAEIPRVRDERKTVEGQFTETPEPCGRVGARVPISVKRRLTSLARSTGRHEGEVVAAVLELGLETLGEAAPCGALDASAERSARDSPGSPGPPGAEGSGERRDAATYNLVRHGTRSIGERGVGVRKL